MTEPEKTESRFSGSGSKAKWTLMWLGYNKARQGKDNSAQDTIPCTECIEIAQIPEYSKCY